MNNPNISKSLKEFIINRYELSANSSQLNDSLAMLSSNDLQTLHHGIMNIRQILIKDDFNLR